MSWFAERMSKVGNFFEKWKCGGFGFNSFFYIDHQRFFLLKCFRISAKIDIEVCGFNASDDLKGFYTIEVLQTSRSVWIKTSTKNLLFCHVNDKEVCFTFTATDLSNLKILKLTISEMEILWRNITSKPIHEQLRG